jgi:hypothetical protein
MTANDILFTISNSLFEGNEAEVNLIEFQSSSGEISDCTFKNNFATS